MTEPQDAVNQGHAEAIDQGWKETFDQAIEAAVGKDPLTGVLSREGLKMALEREMARSQRLEYPLSVLFVEPDNFKSVNDRHGHAGGDKFLKDLAILLVDSVRTVDRVGRLGGDEFLVVLTGTDIDASPFKAEMIRKKIAKKFGKYGITASIGVSQFTAGQDWEGIVDAANKAMYQAKEKGKNQVAVMTDKSGRVVMFNDFKAEAA